MSVSLHNLILLCRLFGALGTTLNDLVRRA